VAHDDPTAIYTRGGDRGRTSLLSGQRVPKHAPRVCAYGTLDELISCLAVVAAQLEASQNLPTRPPADPWRVLMAQLQQIQADLMVLAAYTATEDDQHHRLARLTPADATRLEAEIDAATAAMAPLTSFILPGGHLLAAHLHWARAQCRRGERELSRLAEDQSVPSAVLVYVNRLSDWLFTMARWVNHLQHIPERPWP